MVEGKAPRSVLVVTVERVYFQCAKAIVRSKLWDPSHLTSTARACRAPARSSPTSRPGKVDAEQHDRAASGAAEGDDLLIGGVAAIASTPTHPQREPLAHVRRHRRGDADRLAVLVERHHDLARMQMQRRARRVRGALP